MEDNLETKQTAKVTWLQTMMRVATIVCCVLGSASGVLAILTSIVPSWFYQSGEESMGWAIQLGSTGISITIIGWVTACFSGRKKWKWLCWNSVFVLSWILAELIRVHYYGSGR